MLEYSSNFINREILERPIIIPLMVEQKYKRLAQDELDPNPNKYIRDQNNIIIEQDVE